MIYDLPISEEQIRRELRNSLHAPMHAVILAVFLLFGFFANSSVVSSSRRLSSPRSGPKSGTTRSHRAFHLKSLHWIHVEHHRSHLNSWLTAISFSFTEKLIFDVGLLGCSGALDRSLVSLNFYGIAAWYVGYLIINSFSHANFEFRPKDYNRLVGKVLTTHDLSLAASLAVHRQLRPRHAGPRPAFGTEWDDYERLYDRVSSERVPLKKLREKVGRRRRPSRTATGQATRMHSAPFYPPLVKPARAPLRFPFNLVKLLGNNLEIIPEAAYREPLVIAPGPPRMAFFTGPDLVKTLLLTRRDRISERRAPGRSPEAALRQRDDLGRRPRLALAARRRRTAVPP